MCTRTEARAAHDARAAAIARLDRLTMAMPTRPPPAPISPAPRAIGAIADIYRGAAATVPLARRRK